MASKKILLVDDDKKVIENVRTFLKALGHDILVALDGQKAIDTIKKEDLALVLLDLQLPSVDGIDILTMLRQDYKGIKVIVITGHAKYIKDRCNKIGYDYFIEKPIELGSLLDAIREGVSGKREEDIEIKGISKARLLFVEPNAIVYGFTCGLFSNKELVKGDYETKVVFGGKEALDSLYDYQPDIIIMYDSLFNMDDVEELSGFLMSSSHKPKTVILHGMFPKHEIEIIKLRKQGIVYCNQNPMTDQELREANIKLIDFVHQECLRQKLIKQ